MPQHKADLTGTDIVTLPTTYLRDWGSSAGRYRRALNARTAENLISIKKVTGRSTQVTLLQTSANQNERNLHKSIFKSRS